MTKYRVYGARKNGTYSWWNDYTAKTEKGAIAKAKRDRKQLVNRIPKGRWSMARKTLMVSRWKAEKL